MKITIFAMETPYPPIHGGRVDIWRRIVALSNLGVSIQLICWDYQSPSQENTLVINQYTQDFCQILYKKNISAKIQRGMDLFQYPLQVTSRIIRGKERDLILRRVAEFKPTVIMADHIHCGLAAQDFSQALSIPYIVRSHDIEHIHYRYWLQAAKGLDRLKLLLALWHLKDYEFSVLEHSLAFYDISIDDLQFWESQGLTNGRFLPPLAEFSINVLPQSSQISECQKTYDVVFLGNLRTENNVAGVLWFIDEVLPKLRAAKPDISVLIAGSNPVASIIEKCQDSEGVRLIANPESASEIYSSGRVLINPVAVGSGTSIKSIDMLAFNRPIVTLEKGLAGLPEKAKQYFMLASDSEAFCQLTLEGIEIDYLESNRFEEIESLFGIGAIREFVDDLKNLLNQQTSSEG